MKRDKKTNGLGWAESACCMSSISTMIGSCALMKTFPFNQVDFILKRIPSKVFSSLFLRSFFVLAILKQHG